LKYPLVAGMGTTKEYVATKTTAENTAVSAMARAPFELEVIVSLCFKSSYLS